MTNSWPAVVKQVFSLLRENHTRQAELAERLGVSEGHVSQLLRASANPTLFSIEKVASALDCEVVVWLIPRRLHRSVFAELIGRLLDSGVVEKTAERIAYDVTKARGVFNAIRQLLGE